MAKINLSHNNEQAQILQGENDSQIGRYNKYEKAKGYSTPTTNAQRDRESEKRQIRRGSATIDSIKKTKHNMSKQKQHDKRKWTLICSFICVEKEGMTINQKTRQNMTHWIVSR